jgi:two-component system response regulator AtoC
VIHDEVWSEMTDSGDNVLTITGVSDGAPCRGHVLIVDDEVNMQLVLSEAFEDEGHSVSTASNGAEAIAAIQASDFDLLILDLKLPDMTGIDLFRVAQEMRPGAVAIMITAYSSIDTAIEAMKMGAYDYITKPFNVEKLLMVAGNAIEGRILSGPRLTKVDPFVKTLLVGFLSNVLSTR